jgi:diguanylate cyclase (GGDEF)-like protein
LRAIHYIIGYDPGHAPRANVTHSHYQQVRLLQFQRRNLRLILIAGLVLALIIMANAAVSIYLLRQNTMNERAKQLENLSFILSEHTAQIMFSANTVLDSIMNVVDLAKLDTENQYQNFATQESQYRLLVEKTKANPIIDVSTFVASDGAVLSFSREYPAPPINLSDRDYFQWFKKNNSPKTFYSVPVQNKGNGDWVFYLARRVNNSHNEFLGVVLVGVSAEVFSTLYEKIGQNLGDGATISLYRDDRTLLTRWPFIDEMIGKTNTNGVIDQSINYPEKSGHAMFTSAPRFFENDARIERMISFRKMENYPFVTGATITKNLYLQNWAQSSSGVVYSSIFSLLILGTAMSLLFRAYRHNARVQYEAHHDHLTGLPNRALLADRVDSMIALAKRHHTKLALIYIDLDHFKKINDEMDHTFGDRALQISAKRMTACVRDSDTVSRIGGDEFLILLSELTEESGAMLVAKKLLKAISAEMMIEDKVFTLHASIGIAIYPDHGADQDALQKNADLAMYAAKNAGRNNIKIFNAEIL